MELMRLQTENNQFLKEKEESKATTDGLMQKAGTLVSLRSVISSKSAWL